MLPLLEISGKQKFSFKLSTNHFWTSSCSRNPKEGKPRVANSSENTQLFSHLIRFQPVSASVTERCLQNWVLVILTALQIDKIIKVKGKLLEAKLSPVFIFQFLYLKCSSIPVEFSQLLISSSTRMFESRELRQCYHLISGFRENKVTKSAMLLVILRRKCTLVLIYDIYFNWA